MMNSADKRTIRLLFISALLIFLNLGFVSISFPIGIYALIRFNRRLSSSFWSKNICWLTALFFVGIISCILSPVPFSFKTIYFLIQFGYWLCLARMIGELYPYLDLKQISKCIGWSCLTLGITYISLKLGSQNAVAFILVVLGPIGIYGFNGQTKMYYGLAIALMMLFNDSRSGLAILIAELSVILVLYISRKHIKLLLTLSAILIVFFVGSPSLRTMAGKAIEPYNKDMAILLINPELIQSRDKSWIQRKVQVQKGLQIFKEYPIIGVGPNNFTPTNIDIDYSQISHTIDPNALKVVAKSADNRSTHNTYITLLSEFGLTGILLWSFFIGSIFTVMFKHINMMTEFEILLLISAIGMSVYFYTIAALYGTAAWLLYGLLYGCYRKYKYIRTL